MKDLLNKEIQLPTIGDAVLRDGFKFTVSEVRRNKDLGIVASIRLRGAGGSVEVGYYDYLLLKTFALKAQLENSYPGITCEKLSIFVDLMLRDAE